jgi:3-oxoacyl-[acyl-carrier-protein] synthase-1
VQPLVQISGSGLVTSLGLSTAATTAAIRAGLSNAQLTRFIDWGGEWIAAHVVPIDAPDRRAKLLRMAALAVDECLKSAKSLSDAGTALILCLPEPTRPSTGEPLDGTAIEQLAAALNTGFSTQSATIAGGRAGGLVGLQRARTLLHEGKADAVLVVGVDSYVDWPALSSLEDRHRLLTSKNSNGFIPGEAAAAVLVTRAQPGIALRCEGLGFASEAATIDSEMPLRADGLVDAIRAAAHDAHCGPQDYELRIAALSGEHYFFKEAALAVSRLVRAPKADEDFWHPADCIGEVGSAAGPLAIATAAAACANGHARASRILYHVSGDGPERAAAFFRYGALQ